jgi:uncharacterized protein (DUF1501 family)
MDVLTRRRFLLASGVAAGGALVSGATTMALTDLFATTGRWTAEPASTLVIVTLYGGNDGLNTVIPYADPAYHSARPHLSYAEDKVLHLDGALGLNPRLSGLHKLWQAKQLAIVLGVGYPRPDRSHFRSMDIWQTASPLKPVHTGWVGRWLDGTDARPEAAVSFERVLPPMLAGETRAGACVDRSGLTLPNGIDPTLIAALGRTDPTETSMRARAASVYSDLLNVADLVRQAQPGPVAPGPMGAPASGMVSASATSPLATQLDTVSRCIEAGVPTRVYSVSLDGFDTHADERIWQERLLHRLDAALAGFMTRMTASPRGERVVVMVYSEFGRRVRANASHGTDHGTAGPVLVLGRPVAGGFYGQQPSLTDLVDGDLHTHVDLRDLFGTALASVLGAEPDRYLDGYRPRLLPLFRPA